MMRISSVGDEGQQKQLGGNFSELLTIRIQRSNEAVIFRSIWIVLFEPSTFVDVVTPWLLSVAGLSLCANLRAEGRSSLLLSPHLSLPCCQYWRLGICFVILLFNEAEVDDHSHLVLVFGFLDPSIPLPCRLAPSSISGIGMHRESASNFMRPTSSIGE